MLGNDEDGRKPALAQASATRREVIKNNIKTALAIGTSIVLVNRAEAAPKPPCFLRGTNIRTVDGERRVEDIAVGDMLPTAFGKSRAVQWVGRWQARKATGSAWSKHLRPVCIKMSALAPDMPYEDLYVSRGHAIFIDGVLVPAGQLVNGSSITLHEAEETDELEYFHIKLMAHDVIYAAGIPAETLLKYSDAGDLPDHVADSGDLESGKHCAPVLCYGRRSAMTARVRSLATPWLGPQPLDVIRARLQERAAMIGC